MMLQSKAIIAILILIAGGLFVTQTDIGKSFLGATVAKSVISSPSTTLTSDLLTALSYTKHPTPTETVTEVFTAEDSASAWDRCSDVYTGYINFRSNVDLDSNGYRKWTNSGTWFVKDFNNNTKLEASEAYVAGSTTGSLSSCLQGITTSPPLLFVLPDGMNVYDKGSGELYVCRQISATAYNRVIYRAYPDIATSLLAYNSLGSSYAGSDGIEVTAPDDGYITQEKQKIYCGLDKKIYIRDCDKYSSTVTGSVIEDCSAYDGCQYGPSNSYVSCSPATGYKKNAQKCLFDTNNDISYFVSSTGSTVSQDVCGSDYNCFDGSTRAGLLSSESALTTNEISTILGKSADSRCLCNPLVKKYKCSSDKLKILECSGRGQDYSDVGKNCDSSHLCEDTPGTPTTLPSAECKSECTYLQESCNKDGNGGKGYVQVCTGNTRPTTVCKGSFATCDAAMNDKNVRCVGTCTAVTANTDTFTSTCAAGTNNAYQCTATLPGQGLKYVPKTDNFQTSTGNCKYGCSQVDLTKPATCNSQCNVNKCDLSGTSTTNILICNIVAGTSPAAGEFAASVTCASKDSTKPYCYQNQITGVGACTNGIPNSYKCLTSGTNIGNVQPYDADGIALAIIDCHGRGCGIAPNAALIPGSTTDKQASCHTYAPDVESVCTGNKIQKSSDGYTLIDKYTAPCLTSCKVPTTGEPKTNACCSQTVSTPTTTYNAGLNNAVCYGTCKQDTFQCDTTSTNSQKCLSTTDPLKPFDWANQLPSCGLGNCDNVAGTNFGKCKPPHVAGRDCTDGVHIIQYDGVAYTPTPLYTCELGCIADSNPAILWKCAGECDAALVNSKRKCDTTTQSTTRYSQLCIDNMVSGAIKPERPNIFSPITDIGTHTKDCGIAKCYLGNGDCSPGVPNSKVCLGGTDPNAGKVQNYGSDGQPTTLDTCGGKGCDTVSGVGTCHIYTVGQKKCGNKDGADLNSIYKSTTGFDMAIQGTCPSSCVDPSTGARITSGTCCVTSGTTASCYGDCKLNALQCDANNNFPQICNDKRTSTPFTPYLWENNAVNGCGVGNCNPATGACKAYPIVNTRVCKDTTNGKAIYAYTGTSYDPTTFITNCPNGCKLDPTNTDLFKQVTCNGQCDSQVNSYRCESATSTWSQKCQAGSDISSPTKWVNDDNCLSRDNCLTDGRCQKRHTAGDQACTDGHTILAYDGVKYVADVFVRDCPKGCAAVGTSTTQFKCLGECDDRINSYKCDETDTNSKQCIVNPDTATYDTLPSLWKTVATCEVGKCDRTKGQCAGYPAKDTRKCAADGKTIQYYDGNSYEPKTLRVCQLANGCIADSIEQFKCAGECDGLLAQTKCDTNNDWLLKCVAQTDLTLPTKWAQSTQCGTGKCDPNLDPANCVAKPVKDTLECLDGFNIYIYDGVSYKSTLLRNCPRGCKVNPAFTENPVTQYVCVGECDADVGKKKCDSSNNWLQVCTKTVDDLITPTKWMNSLECGVGKCLPDATVQFKCQDKPAAGLKECTDGHTITVYDGLKYTPNFLTDCAKGCIKDTATQFKCIGECDTSIGVFKCDANIDWSQKCQETSALELPTKWTNYEQCGAGHCTASSGTCTLPPAAGSKQCTDGKTISVFDGKSFTSTPLRVCTRKCVEDKDEQWKCEGICDGQIGGKKCDVNKDWVQICVDTNDLKMPSDWTNSQQCGLGKCDPVNNRCAELPKAGLKECTDGYNIKMYDGLSYEPKQLANCPSGCVTDAVEQFKCKGECDSTIGDKRCDSNKNWLQVCTLTTSDLSNPSKWTNSQQCGTGKCDEINKRCTEIPKSGTKECTDGYNIKMYDGISYDAKPLTTCALGCIADPAEQFKCKGDCDGAVGTKRCDTNKDWLQVCTATSSDLSKPTKWTNSQQCGSGQCDSTNLRCASKPTAGTKECIDGHTITMYDGTKYTPDFLRDCSLGCVAADSLEQFKCKGECDTVGQKACLETRYSKVCLSTNVDTLPMKWGNFEGDCGFGMCDPTTFKCTAEKLAYTAGQKVCSDSGKDIMISTNGKDLAVDTTCKIGCQLIGTYGAECKGECTLGTTRCSVSPDENRYIQACVSSDKTQPTMWANLPGGDCGLNNCDPATKVCKPKPNALYSQGQRVCTGPLVQESQDGFTLVDVTTCDSKAPCVQTGLFAACVGECTVNTFRCLSDGTLQKCSLTENPGMPTKWNNLKSCGAGNCLLDPIADCKEKPLTYTLGHEECSKDASAVMVSRDGFSLEVEYSCTQTSPCVVKTDGKIACKGECENVGQGQCVGSQYAQICTATPSDKSSPTTWVGIGGIDNKGDCGFGKCDETTKQCKSAQANLGKSTCKDGYQIKAFDTGLPLVYCPLGCKLASTDVYTCNQCILNEKKCVGQQPVICSDNQTMFEPLGAKCPNTASSEYGYCLNGDCKKACILEGTSKCSTDKTTLISCANVFVKESETSCPIGCVSLSTSLAKCDTLSFVLQQQGFLLAKNGDLTIPVKLSAATPSFVSGKSVNAKLCTTGLDCTGANVLKEAVAQATSNGEVTLVFTGLDTTGTYDLVMSTSTTTGLVETKKTITLAQDVTIKVLKPDMMVLFTGGEAVVEVEVKGNDGNLLDVSGLSLTSKIGDTAVTPKATQKVALGTYDITYDNPPTGRLTIVATPEVASQKLSAITLELDVKKPSIKVNPPAGLQEVFKGKSTISATTIDVFNQQVDVDSLTVVVKDPSNVESTQTMTRMAKGSYESINDFTSAGTYTVTFIPHKANYDEVPTTITVTVKSAGTTVLQSKFTWISVAVLAAGVALFFVLRRRTR